MGFGDCIMHVPEKIFNALQTRHLMSAHNIRILVMYKLSTWPPPAVKIVRFSTTTVPPSTFKSRFFVFISGLICTAASIGNEGVGKLRC